MNLNKFTSLFFIASASLLISFAANAQQAEPAAAEATAFADELITTTDEVEVVATPDVAEEATEESAEVLDPAMQIPVDGSSLRAFNKSLEEIKEQANEANYTTLENAIQYLLVYDLGVGRDKAKLAENLDGLTGDQIIDKVQWRK